MIRSSALGVLLICAIWCGAPNAHAWSADDIPFIALSSAGDSFIMGDGMLGPNAAQTVSYDFSISRFPITNSQFGEFVGDGGYDERSYWTANGWKWKGKRTQPAFWTEQRYNGPDQPVVGVSWYEAVAFCNWMSAKSGLRQAYDDDGRADLGASGYRLPTEVEWEYAAAKGAPDQAERIFPWGDVWDPKNVVCSVRPAKATCTASVGSRSPQGDTPQGLADMSGNVWQWCGDNVEGDNALASPSQVDRYYFKNDSPSESMMLRGASWYNVFQNGFRSAFRGFKTRPDNRQDVIGFRIVFRGDDRE